MGKRQSSSEHLRTEFELMFKDAQSKTLGELINDLLDLEYAFAKCQACSWEGPSRIGENKQQLADEDGTSHSREKHG